MEDNSEVCDDDISDNVFRESDHDPEFDQNDDNITESVDLHFDISDNDESIRNLKFFYRVIIRNDQQISLFHKILGPLVIILLLIFPDYVVP